MPIPKLDRPDAEEREILDNPEVQKALAPWMTRKTAKT
jgi:hypothetical protein